ncbi:fructokinase-1-like [Hibiscus syriacus]|uniref:fructokinase-1-like n=1 Tax=Hibiscus syriacus TaxID=106335 RepID=UPI0019251566|nr:fructokinase-1-like [Hibiscus syriacus]
MNHQSVTFKNAHFPSHPRHRYHCNPIHSRLLFPSPFLTLHPNTTISKSAHFSFTCRVLHTPLLNHPSGSLHTSNAVKPAANVVKIVDVATLGNLCVDIVLNVPELPPPSSGARKAFMEQLAASPPDKRYWEAGGNCNMAIAAARLGLKCITIGHVGSEIYGKFLLDVHRDEGIGLVEMSEETDVLDAPSSSYETLLCWVLVDPSQKHGFCSRADFSKEPAFSWMNTLSEEVKRAIKRSRILFCNGYGFDDLSPDVIVSAVEYAAEVGTSVFFDPGPRGKSLLSGTVEEQKALRHFLRMSDVLLTADELPGLTGLADPILAGQELLKKGNHAQWVLVKMGSKGSILITKSGITCAPAFKVKIVDTVGCGDSFVAAIAFGFIHDIPLVTTLAFANAVGAATAMGCGAGRNVATMKKVVELIETPDLNEDNKFWNKLLNDHVNSQEVTLLSKSVLNGSNGRVKHVTLQNVVSELLPKLTSNQFEGKLSS